MFEKECARLAVEILKTADTEDFGGYSSEDGYIRVDPDLLFRFYILANTVDTKTKQVDQ